MEQRHVVRPVVVEDARDLATANPAIAPRWLDVDTAAQYLCMTRDALYHQVARLQLPFVRHGRLIRFDREARGGLQAGGDIYKLSKILGHSSAHLRSRATRASFGAVSPKRNARRRIAVTEAHYVHLLREDLVAASEQVRIPVAPRPGGNLVRMPRRRAAGSDAYTV